MPSLEHRRRRGDMIDTYKYVTGLYNVQSPKLTLSKTDTRGHRFKLFKKFAGTTIRKAYFSERILEDWNSLPDSVVAAESVNAFKNRLDAHWSAIETLHNPGCYN